MFRASGQRVGGLGFRSGGSRLKWLLELVEFAGTIRRRDLIARSLGTGPAGSGPSPCVFLGGLALAFVPRHVVFGAVEGAPASNNPLNLNPVFQTSQASDSNACTPQHLNTPFKPTATTHLTSIPNSMAKP